MSDKIDLNKILEEMEKEAVGNISKSQKFSQKEIKKMLNQKNEEEGEIIDCDKK